MINKISKATGLGTLIKQKSPPSRRRPNRSRRGRSFKKYRRFMSKRRRSRSRPRRRRSRSRSRRSRSRSRSRRRRA